MTKHHARATRDAVCVRGLRKRYRDVQAVDGVDLDVGAGEIFALLGPNGAGKTTIVEILEGHRSRDCGTVSVLGEDPARAGRTWRARIGIVSQDVSDSGELTARETVAHFCHYYRGSRRPDEVLELVGLAKHGRRRVRLLSGGQRRRLDVAIGILGRPRLLFLDEPTTGFDPEARRQFWSLIKTLAGDGTTILLTTHYLDEAEALADRVAVITRGRIVAQGMPASLGGREGGDATVSWLEGATARSQRTADPALVVAELSARFGGAIPGLTITRPSLEDVYLDLIGESS